MIADLMGVSTNNNRLFFCIQLYAVHIANITDKLKNQCFAKIIPHK